MACLCSSCPKMRPKIWPEPAPEKKGKGAGQPAKREGALAEISYQPQRRRRNLRYLEAMVGSVRRRIPNAQTQAWKDSVGRDVPQIIAPTAARQPARLWPENDSMDEYGSRWSNDGESGALLTHGWTSTTAERAPRNEIRPVLNIPSDTFRSALSPSSQHLDSLDRPTTTTDHIRAAGAEIERQLLRRPSETSRCSEIQRAEPSEEPLRSVSSNLFANIPQPGLGPPPVFFAGKEAKSSSSSSTSLLPAKRFGDETLGTISPAQIGTTTLSSRLDCAAGTRLQQQSLVTFATPYQSPARVTAAHMDNGTSSLHVQNEDRSTASRNYVTLRAFLAPVFEGRSRLTV